MTGFNTAHVWGLLMLQRRHQLLQQNQLVSRVPRRTAPRVSANMMMGVNTAERDAASDRFQENYDIPY
jgi:hypothetical protein